jgi:hypothetical protein
VEEVAFERAAVDADGRVIDVAEVVVLGDDGRRREGEFAVERADERVGGAGFDFDFGKIVADAVDAMVGTDDDFGEWIAGGVIAFFQADGSVLVEADLQVGFV